MSEPGADARRAGGPDAAVDFVREGFARMRTIADTVLYEGDLLYPYRASAEKNQLRWQFGVLAPQVWSEATGLETWWTQTECLVEAGAGARVVGRARFLHPEARRLEARREDGSYESVPRLEAEGRVFTAWDEATVREIDFAIDAPESETLRTNEVAIAFEADARIEPIVDSAGTEIGRYVRTSAPVCGRIRVSCERFAAPRPHLRLRLRTENETPWSDGSAPRDTAMRSSFAGFHLLLVAENGAFVSLQDPPAWAAGVVASCENERAWPVLAGEEGDDTMLFSAPIILSDHPQVAPESIGDLFDATEIDEILSLRTMTLTEAEKREARATDPRAAAIIDRCDGLGPELLERLHGAVRSLRPVAPVAEAGPVPPAPQLYSEGLPGDDGEWEGWTDPTVPGEGSIEIDGVVVERGARVRLHPNRRSDAQDFMLRGREARVEGVYEDLEGRTYLGVTLADEPDADLLQGHGRYFYFFPDEVVPMRDGG
jgi:hypothetical protein